MKFKRDKTLLPLKDHKTWKMITITCPRNWLDSKIIINLINFFHAPAPNNRIQKIRVFFITCTIILNEKKLTS